MVFRHGNKDFQGQSLQDEHSYYHQVLHTKVFFKSNRTKAGAQMLEEPMGIAFWEYGSNKIEKESRTRQGWCCEAGVEYPRILNSRITR